jgi:hypothetical protein
MTVDGALVLQVNLTIKFFLNRQYHGCFVPGGKIA